jgi:hypothetical protein
MNAAVEQVTLNATVIALTEGMGSDIARVEKLISRYGQPLVDTLGALVSPDQARAMNQKGRLHTVHIGGLIVSQGMEDQGYSRAHAILASIIALAPVGARISFKDAHVTMGAQGDQFTQPIPGVSRARMMRYFQSAGALGTISTRTSSTVGKSGLFTVLGCVEKSDAHGFTIVSKASPLLIAYAMELERLTDSRVKLLNGEE